ncbi:hypothetical protein BJY01DRAFT_251573 [Aspergillus pseudoustus]|uniref:F-box domain-containing protein n=1 Tax=Aspergillus pseudoustus TaxID=1810923 RepID=A0ABR4JBL8_9EURO
MAGSQQGNPPVVASSQHPRVMRHPFSLGYDISVVILQHLPLADAVRLERVSWEWKSLLREWLAGPEGRLRLLAPWSSVAASRDCNVIFYKEAKRLAEIRHRLQTGKTVSSHLMTGVDFNYNDCQLTAAGSYVAWRGVGNFITPLDTMAWRRETVISLDLRPGLGHRPGHYSWRTRNQHVETPKHILGSVERIRTNSRGDIMLKVISWDLIWGRNRILVYSATERRPLWEYLNEDPCRGNSIVPLEIGREHVYSAIPTGPNLSVGLGTYDMVVYNFRTNEKVSRTPCSLLHHHGGTCLDQVCSCNRPDVNGPFWQWSSSTRLVTLRNGDEFIIWSSSRPSTQEEREGNPESWMTHSGAVYTVDIFRASTGELIQSLSTYRKGANNIMVDPVTDQLVFMWNNSCLQDFICQHGTDDEHTVKFMATVIWPVSLNAKPESRLGDAVVFWTDPQAHVPSPIVHPFAMTAISIGRYPGSSPALPRELLAHRRFIRANDEVLMKAATELVSELFHSGAPIVSQCYLAAGNRGYIGNRPLPVFDAHSSTVIMGMRASETAPGLTGDNLERLVLPISRLNRLLLNFS